VKVVNQVICTHTISQFVRSVDWLTLMRSASEHDIHIELVDVAVSYGLQVQLKTQSMPPVKLFTVIWQRHRKLSSIYRTQVKRICL